MTKLCKDCKHHLYVVHQVTRQELFFANDGTWCREALTRVSRARDRTDGGYENFNHFHLDAANVKRQRVVYPVFDILSSTCGSRGRWFVPKEV